MIFRSSVRLVLDQDFNREDTYTCFSPENTICPSEHVQTVERIVRVRIVMEKEPKVKESVDQSYPIPAKIAGDPDKFRRDVAIYA